MTEKISINVKIVSLSVEHDFIVPYEMLVKDAVKLIVKIISEEYPGTKRTEENELIQISSGKKLNPTLSFKQMRIVSGDNLLLL